jgi:DNA polymerase III subunit delta
MSYQGFLNETAKGLPAAVYLFYTSDPFLHREALEVIKKLVPESDRDFNLHIFDMSSPDDAPGIQQVLDVTNTISFFGGRRYTILAGNLQKISKKDAEKINAYLSSPAQGSVFIMLHDGLMKKDTKEKFHVPKQMSLDIRESEIPSWIKHRVKMKNLEISDEATDYLIGITGTDLGLLSSEIEKISLIGKQRIETPDIVDIAAGGRTHSVFDLVNALNMKNAEKVFSIYKILKETADDYSLIGALNWQYTRSIHPGMNKAENSYYRRVFELLNMVDKDIKSSGRSYPVEYLLVKLLRLKKGQSEA